MEKVMKVTVGLFFLILIGFLGFLAYSGYVDTRYRESINGTYVYTCTITTDSPLLNVTFFIPVPEDLQGNSPVISAFSGNEVAGVPADWTTTLYDTGKSTMVKVTVPAIIPPAGTTAADPYPVSFSFTGGSGKVIDTRDPVGKSAVFRPVQALAGIACPGNSAGPGSRCFTYTTPLFAEYQAPPGTAVSITSAVTGRNTWTIFSPQWNEYTTGISARLKGDSRGWVVAEGFLMNRTGSYDPPFSL